MPASQVDWSTPIAVLVVGLIVGALLIWRSRGGGTIAQPEPTDAGVRRDLDGERDALIRQLHDGATTEDTGLAQADRYALELRAAEAWRAADRAQRRAQKETPAEASAAARAPATPRGPLVGFAWGVATAAAVAGLIFAVDRDGEPRPPGQPGTMSGAAPAAEPVTPDLQRLSAAVARNPEDVDARLDLARAHLERREMMAVYEETQAVLERSPGHPRALAYQSLVRLAMGQGDLALQMLDEAIGRAPDLLEPYVHKALVLVQLGRADEAGAAIAAAAERHPDQAQQLSALFGELKSAAAQRPPPAPSHPEVGSPIPPRAASADDLGVAGVIDLAPGTTVAPGALLFIFARAAGVASGPPIAVRRLQVSAFPIDFRLGAQDSMMGQELPQHLRIEARIDSDGDVISRDPADPIGGIDDVPLGATDVRIVMDVSR